ncbi:transglutaminase domain-containing protein [bacterium]|nr:transglutaminase domain-containing protein [bacterium]
MRRAITTVLVLGFILVVYAQYAGKYDIFSDDKKIGECTFEFRKHPSGYVLTSTTTMNIAGTQTISETKTYYDQGYHPTSYNTTVTSPGGKQTISATFSMGKVTLMGSSGIQQMSQELDFPSNGYILDQNIFAHWWVLGRIINPQVGNFSYDIIVPQLMAVQKLSMQNYEEKVFEGQKVTIFEGKQGEIDVNIMIAQNKSILSISFPDQHIDAKLTEVRSLADEKAAIPGGCNELKPSDLEDEDFFKTIKKGKRFEGHISFDPRGRLDRIYLNRRAQTYIGKIEANSIDGDFEIKRMSHRVTLAGEWPLAEPIKTDPEYTSPAPSIDSDDPEIMEKAQKIVESSPTLWEAARAINLWVYRTIEYAPFRYDSKDAVIKQKGDSHSKALVCVAMLRAVNIPARVVRGILMADAPLDHSWVEVFLGQEIGWAPMDPTTGEVDKISARHLSLWLGEKEPPVYARDITIDVKKLK